MATPTNASRQPLDVATLQDTLSLPELAGWQVEALPTPSTSALTQTYQFASFEQAMAFMQCAAVYCAELDHHPDWRNLYDRVEVHLTTHAAQHRVSEFDVLLAARLNEVAAELRLETS